MVAEFQCVLCELKFRFFSELDDHMASDHPNFTWRPKSVEDSLLAASHRKQHRSPHYPSDYEGGRTER